LEYFPGLFSSVGFAVPLAHLNNKLENEFVGYLLDELIVKATIADKGLFWMQVFMECLSND
jgi:hypothetical protein